MAGTTPVTWSRIDEEGFIAIRGRLKRFAKIGGETVSLAVVENIASALWPDNAHAAVAMPDGTQGRADRAGNGCQRSAPHGPVGWAQNHGVSELAIPRRVMVVDAIPVLGTGKTDYVSVQKMAVAEQ